MTSFRAEIYTFLRGLDGQIDKKRITRPPQPKTDLLLSLWRKAEDIDAAGGNSVFLTARSAYEKHRREGQTSQNEKDGRSFDDISSFIYIRGFAD
jgi:hypothetical protein